MVKRSYGASCFIPTEVYFLTLDLILHVYDYDDPLASRSDMIMRLRLRFMENIPYT